MTNDWRNARIEEAERRYPDIEANPETFPTGWSREQERNAFIAGAVFEKALGEATVTPTDADEVISEREALRIAELDARQAAYRQDCTDWFVDHEQEPGITTNAFFRGWDAAVDGGFRRTEIPEPSGEPTCICPNTLGWHTTECVTSRPEPETAEAQAYSKGFTEGSDQAHRDMQGEPSDVTLGVMAQRFYEASGLNIPHTAKPEVVAGLRAAWEVR